MWLLKMAINVLFSCSTKETAFALCKETIRVLSVIRRGYTYWVTGRTGIEGNKIVDRLAEKTVLLEEDKAMNLPVAFREVKEKLEVKFLHQANKEQIEGENYL